MRPNPSTAEGERRAVRPPKVADLFDAPAHAGDLEGAPLFGRAVDDELRVVDFGLWLDAAGRVTRARFKATSCVGLIACAERACQLLEADCPPSALDAERLVRAIAGLHPVHHRRAALVAEALNAALACHSIKELS